MKPIKCSVGGCSSQSDSCRLFCFPKNEKLRSLWLYYVAPTNPSLLTLLLDTLLNRRVCERHFPKDHFDCEGQRIRYSYPCLIKETEILLGEPLVDTEGDCLSDHNYSYRKDGKGADPKLEDLKLKGKTQRKKVANLFLRSESGKASRDLLDKCLTESALITSEPIPVIPAFGVVEDDPLLEERTTESIDQIEDFDNHSNTNEVKVEFNPNICRTCLLDSAVTSLSDYCNDGATLGAMLERITGVKMEDGLPCSICVSCNSDLQLAIAFCRRAQNADQTLRENIALMTPSDDVACPRFKGKTKCDILDVDKKLKTDDECLKTKQIVVKSKAQNDPKSSVKIKLGLQKNTNSTPKISLTQKTADAPNIIENKSHKFNKTYADTSGLKLKAIHVSQIPISQLNKVQMIKLQPNTEQKQSQTETNPKASTAITTLEQKLLNNDAQQKNSGTQAIKTSSEALKLSLVESESDLQTKEAVCPRCKKRFSSIEVMKQHYISHLPKKRLFMCLSCGKKSNSRSEALNHLQTHKQNAKRQSRIQCEECGILVRTQNELTKHINRKHRGERPHKCTECNKCFFYHFDLVQHSNTHLPKESRERPVVCTVCGKSFCSKKNLLSHMKCHSNTSKFECKECGRNFMRQPYLHKHERLVHGRCNKNDTTELAIFSTHYT